MKKLLAGLGARKASLARDVAGIAGCALVAFGVGMIFVPAGSIVAGLMLIVAAIVTAPAR